MPKRLIDDSILTSPSLCGLSIGAQDHWYRFLLLADDFGCFEAITRRLLGRGWSMRPDVHESDIAGWLEEYANAINLDTGEPDPMVEFWVEGARRYVYLTGWFGPHGQRFRGEYSPQNRHGSRRKTPVPPSLREGGAAQARLPLPVAPPLPAPTPPERPVQKSAPAAAPAVAPAPSAASPATTRPLVEHFERLFTAASGETYLMNRADGVQLASLARRVTKDAGSDEAMVERVRRWMDTAFADPWFRSHASIKVFCSQVNSYMAPGRAVSMPLTRPRATAAPSRPEAFSDI